MSARLLAIVLEGEEPAALRGLPALAAVARADDARVRLACLRRLPPARVDRHDRVVADRDREMARIAANLVGRFGAATRYFQDLEIETVVRFGAPYRELAVETEVFAPDRVAFFSAPARAPGHRLRAGLVRRRAARRTSVRLLVFETAPPPRPTTTARPITASS